MNHETSFRIHEAKEGTNIFIDTGILINWYLIRSDDTQSCVFAVFGFLVLSVNCQLFKE